MSEQSIHQLYRFAEKAYIRIQLNDVLAECYDDSSIQPFYEMVDTIIVSGPGALDLLREILGEIATRRNQVQDDLHQVVNGLRDNLQSFGVQVRSIQKPLTILKVKPVRFLEILRKQGVTRDTDLTTCLQLLKDSRDLVESLNAHIHLLNEMINYLEDWMKGLYYHSTHSGYGVRDKTTKM